MKITQKLREHMVAKHGVAADASDEDVKSAVVKSLMTDGGITTKELDELTSEKADDPKAKLAEFIDQRLDTKLSAFGAELVEKLRPKEMEKKPEEKKPEAESMLKHTGDDARKLFAQAEANKDADADGNVRVKDASEWYDGTKRACVWSTKEADRGEYAIGQPAFIFEGSETGGPFIGNKRFLNEPSEKEKAKAGAWLKYRLYQDVPAMRKHIRITEHDMQLIKEALHKDRWVGQMHKSDNFIGNRMLKDFDTKAVLDEAGASVGAEAVPEYFDDMIIRTPLLFGELAPYIQYVPMSRGSSVDGVKIGTPTFVSTAEGSSITPFSTTAFNTAFDTTIFPATCVFEWGIDFESDATPNYMANVIAQIGDESLRWLDEQIAIGDGTTEPQGLFVGTTTAVGSVSGHTAGSMAYADIVNLAFGIDKAHRNAFGGSFTRFVMKDSQYKELWQVATGVTGDTRPVFANPTFQWKSYQLGDYPVSVQNNITTGNLALVNLRGYRMYRRQGISFLQEETGRTLRLLNERMLMARMRWGGQMTLAGYVGEMTT